MKKQICDILLVSSALVMVWILVWSFIYLYNKDTQESKQTLRASQECHGRNGILLTEANGELVCVDVKHYYPDRL
jgi:hypothetical protein